MADTLVFLGTGLAAGLVFAFLYVQVWKLRYTRALRRDAVERSRAVTVGKVFEQLVPWLPDFQFNPKDARFLGTPIDFIVFDGLDEGDVRRIVFVEVKTGNSDLSTRERRVRDAIRERRVEWVEHRVAGG
jgi:predicted Holliday junction resolvase-like endonuclease